jgi:hypothetical protein
MRDQLVIGLLLTILAFWTPPAHAHTRSQSQSVWTIDGDAIDLRVEADALDATRLYALGGDGSLASMLAGEVSRSMRVSANGHACAAESAPHANLADGGRIIVARRFVCARGALARGPVEIESRLFHRVAPSHLHFAALRGDGGTAEAILTSGRPAAALALKNDARAQSFWSVFVRFAPVGVQHVLSGLDHVAFILALVLLAAGNVRALILAATGFTLGHSATLALASAGVITPDTLAIEALIGFTIAFVALEAGRGGEARMRAWSAPAAALLAVAGVAALAGLLAMSPLVWFGMAAFVIAYPRGFPRGAAWLAAIFGLIHGCGFAGALAELDLPKTHFIASLLGFNLGVEVGQLLVIAAALALGLAMKRVAPSPIRLEAAAVSGALLFALGGFWFFSRLAT